MKPPLLLRPLALIPCITLFAVTFVMSYGAMMQADDFDRDMTLMESFWAVSVLTPLAWLAAILAYHLYRKFWKKP